MNRTRIWWLGIGLVVVGLAATATHAAAADQWFQIKNNSVAARSAVHLEFTGTGGAATLALANNAPGCPDPTVSNPGTPWDIAWSSACVDPGESIIVKITSAAGGVQFDSGTWSPGSVALAPGDVTEVVAGVCGNGWCEAGENNCNCSADCPVTNANPNCQVMAGCSGGAANGTCDNQENNCNCAADCPAPAGQPDLVPVCPGADKVIVESVAYADVVTCAKLEGCLTNCVAGQQCRLLKFSATTKNLGANDLFLNNPCNGANPRAGFTYDVCHRHFHFEGFAEFRLKDAAGVVRRSMKRGFCVGDNEALGGGNPPCHYTCACQGLQKNWSDTYGKHLECQWIDVTGLAAGKYTIEYEINPADGTGARRFMESDVTNNVASVNVDIPAPPQPFEIASASGGGLTAPQPFEIKVAFSKAGIAATAQPFELAVAPTTSDTLPAVCGVAVPGVTDWGLRVLSVLLVMAGSLALRSRRFGVGNENR